MTNLPVQLDLPLIKNISEASPMYNEAFNTYTGMDKSIYKRPGLERWVDLQDIITANKKTYTISSVDAGTNVLTATGHTFTNSTPIQFSGTVPAGISINTIYYVRDTALNTFKVSTTMGGTAVDITSTTTGSTASNATLLSAPVDGVYWWPAKSIMLAVCNQRVFKITDSFGAGAELIGASGTLTQLNKNQPVTFDLGFSSDYQVLFCNGTHIFYTDGLTSYVSTVDSNLPATDTPKNVTHIAFLDLYTIANDTGASFGQAGQFYYSNLADFTTWDALDTDVAYTNPDPLSAVHMKDRELILVGTKSIESFYNDGTSPFSRNDAACIESGCSAPYSFAYCNNTWYWLDDKRQVVRREGRTAAPLLTAFNTDIQSFTTVSDAKAIVINLNGYWYYILTFPTENRTFVYNATNDRWEGEWTYWDTVSADHTRFLGSNYTYCDAWNIHAIGSRKEPVIYKLKETIGSDDSGIIKVVKQTGTFNFGTSDTKWGVELIINVRRGATASVTDNPIMQVRWKNDNRQWGAYKEVHLGQMGDSDAVIRIKAPGRFRTRKYEFVFSDTSALELLSVEQSVDIL